MDLSRKRTLQGRSGLPLFDDKGLCTDLEGSREFQPRKGCLAVLLTFIDIGLLVVLRCSQDLYSVEHSASTSFYASA